MHRTVTPPAPGTAGPRNPIRVWRERPAPDFLTRFGRAAEEVFLIALADTDKRGAQ